ncbi:hypothetical protein BDY21DRAFT_338086, partial [Lineolata rhizophorae]
MYSHYEGPIHSGGYFRRGGSYTKLSILSLRRWGRTPQVARLQVHASRSMPCH